MGVTYEVTLDQLKAEYPGNFDAYRDPLGCFWSDMGLMGMYVKLCIIVTPDEVVFGEAVPFPKKFTVRTLQAKQIVDVQLFQRYGKKSYAKITGDNDNDLYFEFEDPDLANKFITLVKGVKEGCS